MEMSSVPAHGAQLQLPWPFPRNHAQGLQQDHQHQENPFNKSPNSQHQQIKGWRRTMIITRHKRISRLTKGFAMDFLLKVHTPRALIL